MSTNTAITSKEIYRKNNNNEYNYNNLYQLQKN